MVLALRGEREGECTGKRRMETPGRIKKGKIEEEISGWDENGSSAVATHGGKS